MLGSVKTMVYSLRLKIKFRENQPRLKNFNLNLILTCTIICTFINYTIQWLTKNKTYIIAYFKINNEYLPFLCWNHKRSHAVVILLE